MPHVGSHVWHQAHVKQHSQQENHHRLTFSNRFLLGTWLHGRAGDLAREEKGRYSVLARDLIGKLAQAMKVADENIRHGKIRGLEIEQK